MAWKYRRYLTRSFPLELTWSYVTCAKLKIKEQNQSLFSTECVALSYLHKFQKVRSQSTTEVGNHLYLEPLEADFQGDPGSLVPLGMIVLWAP